MPPLDQLLRETQAECELDERESGDKAVYPLTLLAQAYAYSGEFGRAIRTAQATGGLWGDVAISICLGLQLQLTGNPPEISPGLSDDAALLVHQKLADLHAEAGRLTAAFDAIARIPVNRGTAFIRAEAYLRIAREQLDRGEAAAAREPLTSALKAALNIPPSTRQLQLMLPLAELMVQVGDLENALAAARSAEQATLQYVRAEGIVRQSAIMWAQVGKVYALVGETNASETAFRRAVEFATVASASDEYVKGDSRLQHRSEAFSEIAALQRSVGHVADADKSVRRAIRLAQRLKDDGTRPFQLSNVFQTQLEAGHYEAALAVAEHIEDRYYRSLCLCRLADARWTKSDPGAARELLSRAQRLADTEPQPERRMQILIHVAESQAKSGEREEAISNFRRAENIAGAIDTGFYQLIARSQIRADLLTEGWALLNRIEEREWRVLPLAELTLAVAKRDHAARMEQELPAESR